MPFRSTIEPHRHAGLETGLSTLRIESQAQSAAIMIADRAAQSAGGQGCLCGWCAPNKNQADHHGRSCSRDAVPLLHQDTKAALRAGTTSEELMEAIWVAAEMRAGGAYAHSALMLATVAEQEAK